MRRGDELLISCHRLCPGQDQCWAALTAKGTLDFGSVADGWGVGAGDRHCCCPGHVADACPAPSSGKDVQPVTGKV